MAGQGRAQPAIGQRDKQHGGGRQGSGHSPDKLLCRPRLGSPHVPLSLTPSRTAKSAHCTPPRCPAARPREPNHAHLLQLCQQQLHELRHGRAHSHTHIGQGEGKGTDAQHLHLTLAQHAVAQRHKRQVLLLRGVAGLDELQPCQTATAAVRAAAAAAVRAAQKSSWPTPAALLCGAKPPPPKHARPCCSYLPPPAPALSIHPIDTAMPLHTLCGRVPSQHVLLCGGCAWTPGFCAVLASQCAVLASQLFNTPLTSMSCSDLSRTCCCVPEIWLTHIVIFLSTALRAALSSGLLISTAADASAPSSFARSWLAHSKAPSDARTAAGGAGPCCCGVLPLPAAAAAVAAADCCCWCWCWALSAAALAWACVACTTSSTQTCKQGSRPQQQSFGKDTWVWCQQQG